MLIRCLFLFTSLSVSIIVSVIPHITVARVSNSMNLFDRRNDVVIFHILWSANSKIFRREKWTRQNRIAVHNGWGQMSGCYSHSVLFLLSKWKSMLIQFAGIYCMVFHIITPITRSIRFAQVMCSIEKKNARTLCTISWVSRLLLAINHTQFFCRMHRHSKQKYVVAWLIFQYRTACTPWARWLHSVLVFWLAFFVLAALFPLACCCTNAYLYGEPRSNCGDDVHDLS